MESSALAIGAVAGGVFAMVYAGLQVAIRAMKAKRSAHHRNGGASPHMLEIKVDGQTFIIDVGAIDREDPSKLDRAIQAVRDVKHMAAA